MSQFELTPVLSQYLDRHLVFPLLEFLGTLKLHSDADVLEAKLELLSKTNMVDFAIDIWRQLHGSSAEVPQEMKDKRESVVAKLQSLEQEIMPVAVILQNRDTIQRLREEKDLTPQRLTDTYGLTPENLDALYRFAKFQFDCGNYSSPAEYLSIYRTLSNNADRNLSALWGKFAGEILDQKWDTAFGDLNAIKGLIDSKNSPMPPLKQLMQRTWLMHWSLFVFFNQPNGRNGVLDLFLQEEYMTALQTQAPHLLRYLTTAAVISDRQRAVLPDIVRVLQQEHNTYKDPITQFVESLYINFDFELAQHKLVECEPVLLNDFFLAACAGEFIDNARMLIFETYCRIHQKIDIAMLAEKLNLLQDDAERWIVNLVRGAQLDAKIDSAANHVIMAAKYPSIYQQVLAKTKDLADRSLNLQHNVERKLQGAH